MPTFEQLTRFLQEWKKLTPAQQAMFKKAIKLLVADLKAGKGFRKGLRVKRVRGTKGVWEMTWAPNGRATWHYGEELSSGDPHIVWRRIGGHEIFDRP